MRAVIQSPTCSPFLSARSWLMIATDRSSAAICRPSVSVSACRFRNRFLSVSMLPSIYHFSVWRRKSTVFWVCSSVHAHISFYGAGKRGTATFFQLFYRYRKGNERRSIGIEQISNCRHSFPAREAALSSPVAAFPFNRQHWPPSYYLHFDFSDQKFPWWIFQKKSQNPDSLILI